MARDGQGSFISHERCSSYIEVMVIGLNPRQMTLTIYDS